MTTVLVGIDPGHQRDDVAAVAGRWAAASPGVDLAVVSAFVPDESEFDPVASAESKERLTEEVIRLFRRAGSSVTPETVLLREDADVEQAITEAVERWDPDLLIVGSHRAESAGHDAGEVAPELAARLDVPVMIVPAPGRAFLAGTVVVGIDGLSGGAAALGWALIAAASIRAKQVVACYAGNDSGVGDAPVKPAGSAGNHQSLAVELEAREGEPVEVLTSCAERNRAAMIVIGSSPGKRHRRLGHVAEQLLDRADVPVVIVHP